MNQMILTNLSTDELTKMITQAVKTALSSGPGTGEIKTNEKECLYSIKELAEFLGCSTATAQALKNSGKIRYRQFNRKVMFVPREIMEDLGRS